MLQSGRLCNGHFSSNSVPKDRANCLQSRHLRAQSHRFSSGAKAYKSRRTSYLCDESSFVLTSVDVPVVSQIVRASVQEPLLSLCLALDMSVVREILSQQELPEPVLSPQTHGIAIGKTTDELLSACTRLMDLLDNPEDIPFFSNMIQREIVYPSRSSRTPSPRDRHVGQAKQQTAKAIGWLRANSTNLCVLRKSQRRRVWACQRCTISFAP
jgi:hypothetical protein